MNKAKGTRHPSPVTRHAVRPWYREPWPWILMAAPAAAIVGCAVTIWLAMATADGLVAGAPPADDRPAVRVAALEGHRTDVAPEVEVLAGQDQHVVQVSCRDRDVVAPPVAGLRDVVRRPGRDPDELGEDFGGRGAGTRPKELVLLALAGCTGSDVVSILTKKRAPLDRLELNVTAEETDEHPRVYTRIHVEYVFHGDGLRAPDLERAIELSEEKYCSVSAMLRPAVALTHSYRIEPVLAAAAR